MMSGVNRFVIFTSIGNREAVLATDYDALRNRLEQAEQENICDACAGTGKPVSGIPCMCKGTGKMSVAAETLREELATLTAKCEEQAKRISRLEDAIERQRRGVKGESRRIYRKT